MNERPYEHKLNPCLLCWVDIWYRSHNPNYISHLRKYHRIKNRRLINQLISMVDLIRILPFEGGNYKDYLSKLIENYDKTKWVWGSQKCEK